MADRTNRLRAATATAAATIFLQRILKNPPQLLMKCSFDRNKFRFHNSKHRISEKININSDFSHSINTLILCSQTNDVYILYMNLTVRSIKKMTFHKNKNVKIDDDFFGIFTCEIDGLSTSLRIPNQNSALIKIFWIFLFFFNLTKCFAFDFTKKLSVLLVCPCFCLALVHLRTHYIFMTCTTAKRWKLPKWIPNIIWFARTENASPSITI